MPDALSLTLSNWWNSIDEFSEADKEAIQDLFDKLSLTTDFLSKESIKQTKEIVDSKYLQKTIKDFEILLSRTTGWDSLEKSWQKFLKENSWVFSTLFAQPVIFFKDEAYVWWKTIDNKDWKFSDFLVKNSLSNNVSFVEIKTHLTSILKNTPYRWTDVFSATEHLTWSITQVMNQRDNLQKEFYMAKGKSKEHFEVFNSKCVVLIWKLDLLSDEQKSSFELFRSNSKDVEIVTFDELLVKMTSLQDILNK